MDSLFYIQRFINTPSPSFMSIASSSSASMLEDSSGQSSSKNLLEELKSAVNLDRTTRLPSPLASALSSMWAIAEEQSTSAGTAFFHHLRDSRYQMVQRRRALHDTLSCLLIRLDHHQEVFEQFVTRFNAIEEDLRFDRECAAELYLRSLELRETLFQIANTRKKTADDFLSRCGVDGVLRLMVHECENEGVVFLQSEYNRWDAVYCD